MFYDRFIRLCDCVGVTPTQVARDIGIRQSVVSMWKKQGTTPKYATLKVLSAYFKCSVDQLVGDAGDDTMPTVFFTRLSELCEEHGISPSAVAKVLGLSNSSATAWRQGSLPKGGTLQRIAEYFNVTVDYLLAKDVLEEESVSTSLDDLIMDRVSKMSEEDKEFLLAVIDRMISCTPK